MGHTKSKTNNFNKCTEFQFPITKCKTSCLYSALRKQKYPFLVKVTPPSLEVKITQTSRYVSGLYV